VSYLDELADEVVRQVPQQLLPDEDTADEDTADEDTGSLFRLYALLALQ
jgi:hypothetical protein